jgi:hypothetical protein
MSAANKIVNEVIENLDEEKRELLLVWSQDAKQIVDDIELSKKKKLTKLYELNTSPVVKEILLAIFFALKKYTWDERSWSGRLALAGLGAGIATAGSQSAGVAAMGGAIGIPLFLLTSAGGALLGLIIDEIKKHSAG